MKERPPIKGWHERVPKLVYCVRLEAGNCKPTDSRQQTAGSKKEDHSSERKPGDLIKSTNMKNS
jgi:hypothetical protein